jgi:small conductance mechanosensitive channel
MACHGGCFLRVKKESQMEMNVEQLVNMSEAWLPAVLQYCGQLTLAVISLLVGWLFINTLT